MTKDEMLLKIEDMRIEYASRDAVTHRLLDVVGHLVMYICDSAGEDVPSPEAKPN